MRGTLTIARRELSSFFRLPVGWVVMALYLFLAGIVFGLIVLAPGAAASMRPFFVISGWLLLPVAPAITMRLFSEELRSGTAEPLMTSPVGDAAVVLGKYLAACVMLVCMLAPSVVHAVLLLSFSDPKPDLGPIVAGYACLALLGAFYVAAGTFASSLTSNQTLSFLGTLFALVLLLLLETAPAERLPVWARSSVAALALGPRIGDFAKGVVDTANVVFFVSGAALFLVLAYVSVQSRRWR